MLCLLLVGEEIGPCKRKGLNRDLSSLPSPFPLFSGVRPFPPLFAQAENSQTDSPFPFFPNRPGSLDPTRSERPSLLPSRPATDTSTRLLLCVIVSLLLLPLPSVSVIRPFQLTRPLDVLSFGSQYGNEAEVGQGIVDSGVPRSEIWLTAKLNNPDHKRVAAAVEDSLKNLGTDYVDLYLMHWPCSSDPADPEVKTVYKDWNFVDTWKEMEKIPESKVRNIGISNFDIVNLEKLLPQAKRLPAVNQIELHPNMPTPKLVKYCEHKGIQ